MSSNEYTNLTILDCNRQHSIQARSGNSQNPALFTNELGKGIELKVGDKVSVQSIYVSEIGAGSDTVELKGEDTGKKRTIYYTKEEYKYPTDINDYYSNGSNALPLITGYQEIELTPNASLTYDVRDNETYLTIQYYLNNSGDSGYMSLPRRFGSVQIPDSITDWNASNWTAIDSQTYGRPYHEPQTGQFLLEDYFYYDISVEATTTGFYKLKNDCSRFTLMKRGSNVLGEAGTTKLRRETISFDSKTDNGHAPLLPNLLEAHYYIYKEPIKISVDKGFTSPNSIAEKISLQLKEASEPVEFIVEFQDVREAITQYVTTKTFKPQLCASSETFTETEWAEFTKTVRANTPQSKEDTWKYYSNYYNIYDKRPEIREAGQNCNNYAGSGQSVMETILYADSDTATIKTNIHFTNANLEELRDLFKAQKLYPEIFSDLNTQDIQPYFNDTRTSVDNARYLHMNTPYSTTRGTILGGDNTDINASNVNNRSLPLFFYFQKENEDRYTDGSDINNMCYGFATKHTTGGVDYIELHPELLGGINPALFQTNFLEGVPDRIHAGTLLGYDYHFNAFATACLMGFSGRLKVDYPLVNAWGLGDTNLWKQQDHEGRNAQDYKTAGLMRYNYVGCNNPKFEYDPDNSRFYFSDLHTPEVNGQAWSSAGDNGSGVSPAIEDNTQEGGNIVYKINKRINPYTYTPDMKPYEYEMDIGYPYGHEASSDIGRKISKPNRNIEAWAVFDSISGIFISDFGYDESEWDNGLWGILGFSYNQFNKTLTSTNNRNSRIVNDNINDLNIPTTNSDIVSTDTRDYIVNQFGAIYFTTQLPSSSTLRHIDFLPAITQNTESIRLVAQNLPRKMLRPYYCIRSDIIDEPHYVGGETSNNTLPVVAICDKQYSGGDFYFSSETDFQFTITKNKTLTSITTSIHDPNQSFANVNNDSAVIYKIESQVVNDTSVAQELLEELKKRSGSRP